MSRKEKKIKLDKAELEGDEPIVKQEPGKHNVVVIVGAGAAGLCAASQLIDVADCQVVVLEARDRLGGRINTLQMSGGVSVDLGASFIHGCTRSNPVYQLSRQLDIEVDMRDGGYSSAWADGATWFHGSSQLSDEEMTKMFELARLVYKKVGERGLDLYRNGDKDVDIKTTVECLLKDCIVELKHNFPGGSELTPKQNQILISMLVLFFGYVAPFDQLGVKNLADFELETRELLEGEEEEEEEEEEEAEEALDGIVTEGYKFLIDYLSTDVDDIRLRSVVRKITALPPSDDVGGALVELQDGSTIRATNVVVTVPVSVLKGTDSRSRIEFEPPLPAVKRRAIETIGMGVENKCIMRFSKCFWRGVTPYFNCTDYRFRFLDMRAFGKGNMLIAHINPPYSIEMAEQDDADILKEVLGVLDQIFPGKVSDVLEYHITNWLNDPFALGSYSFMAKGFDYESYAALREPVGCIHFAGEACSAADAQCVTGAYSTGRLAGLEVKQQLRIRKKGWNPQRLFCVCQKEWDGICDKVCCPSCHDWFHKACIGFAGKDDPLKWWACPHCQKKESEEDEAYLCKECGIDCQEEELQMYSCDNCPLWFCSECTGEQWHEKWTCAKCSRELLNDAKRFKASKKEEEIMMIKIVDFN